LKFLKNFLLYPVNFFLAACIIFFVSSFSTATFLKNFEFYDLPLSQDEVDYALAAKRGIAANYLDSETLSFFDFIELSILKVSADKDAIQAFSSSRIDEKDDLFILRHFHGVVPVYYWSLFVKEDPSISKKYLRISSQIFYSLFVICFLILIFLQLNCPKSISNLSILTLVLFFSSNAFVIANLSMNYHIFLAFFSLFFSSIFVKSINKKNNLQFLSFTIAIMLATLETSIFIMAPALLSLFFLRESLFGTFQIITKIIFFSFLYLVLLWPGFLYSGSIFKSWLMYIYRIFVADNSEYGSISKVDFLVGFISDSMVLVISVMIMLILLTLKKEKFNFFDLPLFLGITYFLIIINFALNITYIVPAITLMIYGLVIKFEVSKDLKEKR